MADDADERPIREGHDVPSLDAQDRAPDLPAPDLPVPDLPAPDLPAPDLAAPDLAADFALLLGDARSEEAARARIRERHLRAAASADATLAGVLLDLAERDQDLNVRTSFGRTVHGRIVLVVHDAIAVATSAGAMTYIPLRAVASVRLLPGNRLNRSGMNEPAGGRAAPRPTSLAALLGDLAAERPRVAVAMTGESALLTGELRAAGTDVLTLRLDGEPAALVYLALCSLSELAVLASG